MNPPIHRVAIRRVTSPDHDDSRIVPRHFSKSTAPLPQQFPSSRCSNSEHRRDPEEHCRSRRKWRVHARNSPFASVGREKSSTEKQRTLSSLERIRKREFASAKFPSLCACKRNRGMRGGRRVVGRKFPMNRHTVLSQIQRKKPVERTKRRRTEGRMENREDDRGTRQ